MFRLLKDQTGMEQILLINGIACAVKSYKKDEFVNLNPIQPARELLADTLSNIRIDFLNRIVSTDGKETPKWRSFVSLIDIDEISDSLQMGKIHTLNCLLAKAKQEYRNSILKALDEIVPDLDWDFREDIAAKIYTNKCDTTSPVEIILAYDGAAYRNPDLSELLAERIHQTKIQNKDLEPIIYSDHWCETCGSHSHQKHPDTGHCFHCNTNNWEPEEWE